MGSRDSEPIRTPRGRDQFAVAAYLPNGELVGTGTWQLSSLSPKWIGVCEGLLEARGPNFETDLDGPLRHLRLKCTSSQGAALLLASIHGRPASSAALVTGGSADVDAEVLTMFADSMRRKG